jgi:hypothetical protein
MQPREDSDTRQLSYMLRLWRRRNAQGELGWCASLEEPGSHHTERFAEIGALFAFLRHRLDTEGPHPPAPDEQ